MKRPAIFYLLAGLALASAAFAADGPTAHALTGATVVRAPGDVLEAATVVFREGVIVAVGAEVEPPADARVWDLEGKTIYAGFIDPYVARPWPDPPSQGQGGGPPRGGGQAERRAQGQAGHPNRLVVPERDMTLHARDESKDKALREAGFTTAHVAPGSGVLRGASVLVNLGEVEPARSLLRRGVAQAARFERAQRRYPESLMGSIALFRQTFLDADWYRRAWKAFENDPAQERPPFNTALEALQPVATGRMPLVFESRDLLGTLRAADLAAELGLKAMIVGNGHEYKRLESIAATGLPHLLPVDFPKTPKVGEEDDLRLGLDELRHWDRAPDNPRLLMEAGVPVAFTAHGLGKPADIHEKLTAAVERGLDRDDALAALTTVPAEILGIDDVAGTLEPGKMANLVVLEGELFTKEAKIREVWIDGQRTEISASKPPEVDPAGTWDLTVDAGEGMQIPLQVVFSGRVPEVTATMTVMGVQVTCDSVEVSGSDVTVTFDGESIGFPGAFSITLTLDGDSADGAGSGPAGDFTVSGTRRSAPGVIS